MRWEKPRCSSRKAAWRAQGEALRALTRLQRENAQAVVPLPFDLKSAYQCPECGAWHLTSKSNGVAG